MTASKQVKAAGLKSVADVSRSLGTKENGHPVVSPQTLDNWSKHKPLLFNAVLLGLAEMEKTE